MYPPSHAVWPYKQHCNKSVCNISFLWDISQLAVSSVIANWKHLGIIATLCPSCLIEQVHPVLRHISKSDQSAANSLTAESRTSSSGIEIYTKLRTESFMAWFPCPNWFCRFMCGCFMFNLDRLWIAAFLITAVKLVGDCSLFHGTLLPVLECALLQPLAYRGNRGRHGLVTGVLS